MKNDRLNNTDRRQWIDNDEHLYTWQRLSGLPMREFIKEHRADLDEYINGIRNRPPLTRSIYQ